MSQNQNHNQNQDSSSNSIYGYGVSSSVSPDTVSIDNKGLDSPTTIADDKSVDSPTTVADDKSVDSPTTVADDKSVDNPATHDVADDKSVDNPATHDVADDKGVDNPATHDVADDKGVDNPATHNAADDKGVDNLPETQHTEVEAERPEGTETERAESPAHAEDGGTSIYGYGSATNDVLVTSNISVDDSSGSSSYGSAPSSYLPSISFNDIGQSLPDSSFNMPESNLHDAPVTMIGIPDDNSSGLVY